MEQKSTNRPIRNTKRTIALFALIFVVISTFGSYKEINLKNGKFGISYSTFGENDVSRFSPLVGTSSVSINQFYSVGLSYLHSLNKSLEFETGIELGYHQLQKQHNISSTIDYAIPAENYYLLDIPIGVRLNFLRYFFVNGGILLDIDPSISSSIDNQTGIGSNFGLGLKYDFKSSMSVYINPYFKIHSLLPFSFENHHQRIFESALRFGVMYQFK